MLAGMGVQGIQFFHGEFGAVCLHPILGAAYWDRLAQRQTAVGDFAWVVCCLPYCRALAAKRWLTEQVFNDDVNSFLFSCGQHDMGMGIGSPSKN